MLVLLRILGWLIFLTSVPILATDTLIWYDTGVWDPLAIGRVWGILSPQTLANTKAILNSTFPFLWNQGIVTILVIWVFAAMMVVGLALATAGTKRRRRNPR